jgi:hypothetical protein
MASLFSNAAAAPSSAARDFPMPAGERNGLFDCAGGKRGLKLLYE